MITVQHWKRTDKVPSSAVVWRGKSALNNQQIVAIVTGLDGGNRNAKTGPDLAQLWILVEGISPLDAIQAGADVSICGTCRHRGDGDGHGRTCYVIVANAPRSVWATYASGGYVRMRPADVATHLASRGMGIRVGAYGDGAALPIQVLADLTHGIFHTGYTHAWKQRPDLRPWLMASVDTPAEFATATAHGWRTFRVRSDIQPLDAREISCPASEESGHRTTCDHCRLCDGARTHDARQSIAILVHGSGTKNFIRLQAIA